MRCSGVQCRNTLFVDCSRCEHTVEKCTTNEVAWNRGGSFEQKSQWWCSHCMKEASSKWVSKAKIFSKSYFRQCCSTCLKATSTQNSHVPALDVTFGANQNYDEVEAIMLSRPRTSPTSASSTDTGSNVTVEMVEKVKDDIVALLEEQNHAANGFTTLTDSNAECAGSTMTSLSTAHRRRSGSRCRWRTILAFLRHVRRACSSPRHAAIGHHSQNLVIQIIKQASQ